MPKPLFGSWQAVGQVNHYFLGDAPLCGRPVTPTGVEPERSGNAAAIVTANHCDECYYANWARWAPARSDTPHFVEGAPS